MTHTAPPRPSDECGIVAQIAGPLAAADISAYYISTFTELHMTEGLTLLFLGELYSALCNVFNVAYCSFFQFYSYLSKGEKFGQLEIGCFIQSILTENLRIHICLSSF